MALKETTRDVKSSGSTFFSIASSYKNQVGKEVIVLNTNSFETTDLFRGAFLLCKGGDLTEIRIKNNGRQIVSFLIKGNGLDKQDRAYRNGNALVNPLQLRESLNHLRDILFEKLHENEGRLRYDRKRKNRSAQRLY